MGALITATGDRRPKPLYKLSMYHIIHLCVQGCKDSTGLFNPQTSLVNG